jgi:phage-related protein
MVHILQRTQPTFAEMVSQGLGKGISQGIDMGTQMSLEKMKMDQRRKLIQSIEGGGNEMSAQPQQDIGKKFLEILPELEKAKGSDLTTEELDQIWEHMNKPQQFAQQMQKDPFSKAKQYAVAGEHELARTAMEEAKLGEKMKLEERKEAHGLAKPTLERGRELLENLPYKENALSTMQDAISSGNLGFFTLDNLAEMTGIEGLRSPEGAAFKTASKEFFLGNLSRVGSRGLNQMMERVVLEMAPLIGRKTEANLAVTEILGAENDVTRKEAELINDIGQSYKEKHGHYPENLQSLVYKELRPFAQERQKEALNKIDKIKSLYAPKNKEGVLMYDPAGNLRRVPYQNRKEAMQQGYRAP